MKTINLGSIVVISDPHMEVRPQPTSARVKGAVSLFERNATSHEEAQRSFPHPILQPTWLPSPDVRWGDIYRLVDPSASSPLVFGIATKYADGRGSLVIKQSLLTSQTRRTYHAVDETMVTGRTAAVLHAPLPDGKEAIGCWWEQGGTLVEIDAVGFTAPEVIRVAESLR
jgi:hypothetical protein